MVDYVQDLFYVFLIAVAVTVPLIAYYIFKHLTTLGGSCKCTPNDCICTPKKGSPPNTDCTTDKLLCELGNIPDAVGAALGELGKLVKEFLSQPLWLQLLEIVVGIPLMVALYHGLKLGFTKGPGWLKDKIAEKFSEDRRIVKQFKDIKKDLIDDRQKIEAENKDLEAKIEAETNEAEKDKLKEQVKNNEEVLAQLKEHTKYMQSMENLAQDMAIAKSLDDAKRQTLKEMGAKAEQIQKSIMGWQDALQSASQEISSGADDARTWGALKRLEDVSNQLEAQKEQYDDMVSDFHP